MKNIILLLAATLFLTVSCEDTPEYESQEEVYIDNLLVTSNKLQFAPAASSQEVGILTRSEEVQASSDQTWCTTSVDLTTEGKSVYISVADNPGSTTRTATVTVTAYNLTKTITVLQEIPVAAVVESAWYTIKPLPGDYLSGQADYQRFFTQIDAMTYATTYQTAGKADDTPEWDMEDPTTYTFTVRLKSLTSVTNVIECDIEAVNPLWPYVYTPDSKVIIYDNTSTYNTITQEFHLNFKTDWGNDYIEQVNERVYGKQLPEIVPAVVESAWYTIENLPESYRYPDIFPRYFKQVGDTTFATTCQDAGAADDSSEWDIEDPATLSFLIHLKSLTSVSNVIKCDVEPVQDVWTGIGPVIFYDNASTYNTVTQEFHLDFYIAYPDYGDYVEYVNERVHNKRSSK